VNGHESSEAMFRMRRIVGLTTHKVIIKSGTALLSRIGRANATFKNFYV